MPVGCASNFERHTESAHTPTMFLFPETGSNTMGTSTYITCVADVKMELSPWSDVFAGRTWTASRLAVEKNVLEL